MKALLKLILILLLLPLILVLLWALFAGIGALLGMICCTAFVVDGWFWLFVISVLVIILLAVFCD